MLLHIFCPWVAMLSHTTVSMKGAMDANQAGLQIWLPPFDRFGVGGISSLKKKKEGDNTAFVISVRLRGRDTEFLTGPTDNYIC